MATEDEWINVERAAMIAGCSTGAMYQLIREQQPLRKTRLGRWVVQRLWVDSISALPTQGGTQDDTAGDRKDEWITVREAAKIAGCSTTAIHNRIRGDQSVKTKPGLPKSTRGTRPKRVLKSWVEGLRIQSVSNTAPPRRDSPDQVGLQEFVSVSVAAQLSSRSDCTIKRWIKVGYLTRHTGSASSNGRPRLLVDAGELPKVVDRLNGERLAREESQRVKNGTHKEQIEGLKTRLAAAEKERDQAITARDKWDQAITARDKWAKDHARQKKEMVVDHFHSVQLARKKARRGNNDAHKAQIEGLKTRLAAAEKERDQAITARDKREKDHARQKKEIQALKLEIQTYADTYAESKPPAVIDRLVSAVESAPLETLMQIDQPRHAALRRVVGLWTAVDHAVGSFYPGDSAQTTNNDDDEVT